MSIMCTSAQVNMVQWIVLYPDNTWTQGPGALCRHYIYLLNWLKIHFVMSRYIIGLLIWNLLGLPSLKSDGAV